MAERTGSGVIGEVGRAGSPVPSAPAHPRAGGTWRCLPPSSQHQQVAPEFLYLLCQRFCRRFASCR